MILVTGATGKVGSEVVQQLVAKGEKVRALVRDAGRAAKLLGPQVELAVGDMAKPETLRAAVQGVDKVFLLSTAESGPMEVLEGNVIDAAKQARVKHVVQLSVLGADMEPGTQIGRWHRAAEKRLEASGIAWTFIRPGGFMSNMLQSAQSIAAQGAFYGSYGEGKSALVDVRDIAAAAVAALTGKGHEGKAYAITGGEALSQAELAAQLSAAVGKPVKYVDVPAEASRKGMLGAGMPPALVEALLEFVALTRAGHGAYVSQDVEKLTGKKPRTFAAWAKENAAAFK